MSLDTFRAKYEDFIISTRRYLHENPEIAFEEKQTCALILKEVEAYGLSYEKVGNYGIIAVLDGTEQRDTQRIIALRADMDALPIQEDPNNLKGPKTCCSKVPNVGHLCGHDAHVAMMLAVMKELSASRNFSGRILFCFEPAEENGRGVWDVLKALEKYHVDCAYAVHVWPSLNAGQISVEAGPRMAGVGAFEYTIVGKATHGAMPHKGLDPILCACDIITQLNMIIARDRSAIEPMSLTVGHIEGGTSRNSIPDEVSFGGTMRFFNRERGEFAYGRLKEIVSHIAAAHRCEAKHTFEYLSYPLINDAGMSAIVTEALTKNIGPQCLGSIDMQSGSDPFTNYIRMCGGKGMMAMVGIGNESLGCGEVNHNPKWDIDESALAFGAYSTLQAVLALLAQF